LSGTIIKLHLCSFHTIRRYKMKGNLIMMIAMYASKKELKSCIGQALNYQETSAFGAEYKSDGIFQ